MVVLEHLFWNLKKRALVDYVDEKFFVNLLSLNAMIQVVDVCMDLKLIKYGISGTRGLEAVPPGVVALLTLRMHKI